MLIYLCFLRRSALNTPIATVDKLSFKHAERIVELREQVWSLQDRGFQFRQLRDRCREFAARKYVNRPAALETINRHLEHIFSDTDPIAQSYSVPRKIGALLASTPCVFTFFPGLGTHESLSQYDLVLSDRFSKVASRRDVSLKAALTADSLIHSALPLYVANMRATIGRELADVMISQRMIPIFHRFARPLNPLDIDSPTPSVQDASVERAEKLEWLKQYGSKSFFSCGVRSESVEFAKQLIEGGALGICVDIALGNSEHAVAAVIELRDYIRKGGYTARIMAGNVDTEEGYLALALAGADIIKVGIGPGSPCTTRLVTRAGAGQGSALMAIGRARFVFGEGAPTFLADGGLAGPADFLAALALQASGGMVGRMAAQSFESAALEKEINGERYGYYFGEASKTARLLNGDFDPRFAVEGSGNWIRKNGSFSELTGSIAAGLANAFPYYNARSIPELQEKFSIPQQLCDLILGQTTGIYKSSPGHGLESNLRLGQ